MNKYTQTLLLSSLLMMFLPTELQAKNYVERLTRPVDVTASNGETYSEIRVVCVGSKSARYISRKAGSTKWCVMPNSDQCRSNKLAAAKRACTLDPSLVMTQSLSSGVAVAKPQDVAESAQETPAEVDAPVAPAVKQVAVSTQRNLEQEQRMIEIEREKIKLRREELELKKQQLEAQVN